MISERLTLDRPSPFRRRRFVVPHRRRSRTRLLLKPFLAALCLVGVPVVAAVWVANSPLFLVSEVRIESLSRIDSRELSLALDDLHHRHLLSVTLSQVEARLADNRWIAGVEVRKELPDRLVIRVRERQPVALLRQQEGMFYVDESGFLIEPYDTAGPVDLPLISVQSGATLDVAAALEVAKRFDGFQGGRLAGLSEIEVLGEGDYRIYTAGLSFPVLLAGAEMEGQLEKLEGLLPEIDRRFASVTAVDLRFARQIVIQPALEPRSEEG